MNSTVYLKSFQLVELHLRGVGPFPVESTATIRFMDKDEQPANFFLIIGPNGQGKTTVLESIAYLVSLLTLRPYEAPAPEWLRSSENAALQLDIRVELSALERPILVSLIAGTSGDSQLKSWVPSALEQLGVATGDDYTWGYSGTPGTRIGQRFEPVIQLAAFIDQARDRVTASGDDLERPTETAPTLIYFTADRDLAKPAPAEQRAITRPNIWTHRIVHRFDHEQSIWVGSLDQLLVWLFWLYGEKGQFKSAQDILNKHVFRGTNKFLAGIQKDPPQAIIHSGASNHRLDQLSSGERNLVQLFLRIAVHMTQNSIVIIDELELHLHPAWARSALVALKDLVRNTPGMTVIFTSHSRDVLERFDLDILEDGLRKQGHLFRMKEFDIARTSPEAP